MKELWEDIKQAISDFFTDLKEWAFDVFAAILDAILNGIASIIESIPLPDAIANFNLADYIGNDIAWMLAQSGFPAGLAIIGACYVFRIMRRLLTLGIW